MKITDLTMPLDRRTPVFPGAKKPDFLQTATIEEDGCNEQRVSMNTHIGTHMDAPSHMLPDGRKLTDYEAGGFCGNAVCFDVRGQEKIENDLNGIGKGDIVLFLTGYSGKAYEKDYFSGGPEISIATAKKLIGRKVKMVGIDSWSPDKEPWDVHKLLFRHDILIVENLVNLEKVAGKSFQFYALPLKIAEAEGAPCRAVAVT